MLDPVESFAAVVGADEIEMAVAIHIQGEAGVVVETIADPLHIAEEVPLPVRGLVPIAAANHIFLSIAIHIQSGTGAIFGLPGDVVVAESEEGARANWLFGAGSLSSQEKQNSTQRQKLVSHRSLPRAVTTPTKRRNVPPKRIRPADFREIAPTPRLSFASC